MLRPYRFSVFALCLTLALSPIGGLFHAEITTSTPMLNPYQFIFDGPNRNYPERTLFTWAREYSSALPSGGNYRELPNVLSLA